MKSFEERRKEYFQNIRKYSKLINDLKEKEGNERTVDILLYPKNELELEFANAYITYIEDTIKISANASCNNVETINLEESVYINYFSSIINAVSNNINIDEINKINEKTIENNCELLAKICYEMIVIIITNPEQLSEYIYQKCGFNIEDQEQVIKFEKLMNDVNKQLKPQLTPESKEDFKKFIAFVKSYHNYCIQGIKNKDNQEVEELITEFQKTKKLK